MSPAGIAVSHVSGYCTEEVADSTLCLILNLYRRTYWLARDVLGGRKLSSPEALSEAAAGSVRIRGETLGIVGFGQYSNIRRRIEFLSNEMIASKHRPVSSYATSKRLLYRRQTKQQLVFHNYASL